MPEAALARELDIPYATLAVVANWAAGKGDSGDTIHLDVASDVFRTAMGRVLKVLECMSGQD